MTFSQMNFNPSISKAISLCGYNQPTPIQKQSIPKILEGGDLVACAQTGTGKTAAFVLPALQRLSLDNTVRKPRVLILTPTRELASQITKAAGRYGKFIQFKMASLVGGMPYRQQLRDLSRSIDMIVATPGRLLDHMENRRLDLSGIEMLILDEADRMLDMGFIDDVQTIAKATPNSRQTLLFSATVDGKLGGVVKNLLKNPTRIDLSQEKISPTQIKQELYMTDGPQHKAQLFQHFLENENIFKAIIFSATKIGADRLAGQLRDQGYPAAALHGDLKQSMRNRTVEDLRRGKIQFVVATDVAARGIDIADMTHVFNYDLPKFCEDYVHRIGRTGRAGKSGTAISFALPSDMKHVTRIERYIGQKLRPSIIEGLEPKKNHQAGASDSKKNRPKKFFGKSSHDKDGFKKSDGKFGGGRRRSEGDKGGFKKSDSKFGSGRNRSEGDKDGFKKSDSKFGGRRRSEGDKDGFKKSDSKFGGGRRRSEGDKDGFKKSDSKFGGGRRRSDGDKDGSRFGRKTDRDELKTGGFGRKSNNRSSENDKPSGKFGRRFDSDKPAKKFAPKKENNRPSFKSKDKKRSRYKD